ncbi:hypothetical protein JCM11641_001371 [Rhodosporidiobolus odoratus]
MSEDAAVLAEIARLSSAIQHHKTAPTLYHNPRGRGRGRGRGASSAHHTSGQHRNKTWTAPGVAPLAVPTSVKGSRSGTTTPVDSRPTTPFDSNAAVTHFPNVPAPAHAAGGTTPVRNKMESLRVDADAGQKKREVVIDGVVFEADARGNKLVRKPGADPSSASDPSSSSIAAPGPSSPSLSTPRRTSHLGTTYIRTKNGNLVSLAFARKRKQQTEARKQVEAEMTAKGERLDRLVGIVKGVQGARNAGRGGRGRGRGRGGFSSAPGRVKPAKPKSDKPCRFFQRTGQCTRAHTCPYVHDSSRIAICPLFLRSSCPRPASSCPLSHTPNAHRSPHCQHFPSCTRPNCPYAHVQVSSDASVCREFVEYGYCVKGEECGMRHVRECWRFSETGKCEVKGCREPHVLRRVHNAGEDVGEEDEDTSNSDDEEDKHEGDVLENEGAVLGASAAASASAADDAAGSKRKRRESSDANLPAGISGAAGRRLKKLKSQKKQQQHKEGGFTQQQDFVEFLLPVSDDEGEDEEEEEQEEEEEEEEEEDGMSVEDDEDLASDDGGAEEAKGIEKRPDPDLLEQVHLAKKDPPANSAYAAMAEDDELDYGLSDDEADAVQIEALLRR